MNDLMQKVRTRGAAFLISQYLIETARRRITSGISPTPDGLRDPSLSVRLAAIDARLAEAQGLAARDPEFAWILVGEAHGFLEFAQVANILTPSLTLFLALDQCMEHPAAAWACVDCVRRWIQTEVRRGEA